MKAKKPLALLMAATMVTGVAACGGSTTTSSSATTAAATTAAETTVAETTTAAATTAAAETTTGADPYADPYAQATTTAAANDPYANPYADPYAQATEATTAAANDPYANPYADPYAQATEAAAEEETTEASGYMSGTYIPESGEKYTVTQTDDGWLKIENEGGVTLGLSTYSGVKLVEDDGYAFKDLDQDGELDAYEDWRLSTEERAADLASQMTGEEMAAVLTHGGWGSITTEPLTTDDTSYTYLASGGRGGVTRSIAAGGHDHAAWANAIQAAAESCYYGIPAMISIDPANISGVVESLSLASTMDTDLAAAIGQVTSQEYRAAGVTALLGPQVDLASPVMDRAGGTYGEDPQLTLDITTAYVNAMQSTYSEDGEDLGWGAESVYCFTKHFAGAGSTEGGRNDHFNDGRYATFPGDNFEAHLIAYIDGAFNLPGKTGKSGIMTEYAVNVDSEGNSIGGEWAGAYNPYLYYILDSIDYDQLIITDWGTQGDFGAGNQTGTWGTEDIATVAEKIALQWQRGVNLLGGNSHVDTAIEAYGVLVNEMGEDDAKALLEHKVYNFFVVMMNLGMFDQPYCDTAYAQEIINGEEATDFGASTQEASVVMIKNAGNVIAQKEASSDKPTVYVPYAYSTNWSVSWFTGFSEGTPSWGTGVDLDVLSNYFNIVTDTVLDPSGEADANGNATYTENDIQRATADEIAACDYVLVGMTAAYSVSYDSAVSGVFSASEPDTNATWYPASLQYTAYTATTARETSVAGLILEDGTRENRSYAGNTSGDGRNDPNYGCLTALQYAAENCGDIPVIVSMCMSRGMVWSEVEPLADVILVCYNKQYNNAVAKIILGQVEPQGLLVFQQPANMETVEAQYEDVPRDMECYVDAEGNTYDFAFGMNWAGVISDERTEKYSAAPISKITSVDYDAIEAAYVPAE